MQNKVDFNLPPDDLFLNPAMDPGVAALGPVDWVWRAIPQGKIFAFSASEHPEIAKRIDETIDRTLQHKRFSSAVEFNTIPLELTHAAFKKSYVTASGRCLLSGASGMRLLNLWYLMHLGTQEEDALASYFTRCQERGAKALFLKEAKLADDVPFAIEGRNTFNFFHFVTESLGQLSLLDDIGGDRPVFLHFPNQEEKTRRFSRDFIEALYPDHAARVTFERAPKRYERVAVPYNLMNSYYHYGNNLVESLDELAPSDWFWKGHHATRASLNTLQRNVVDTNLFRLRERGLGAIEGMDFSHLPRRFYVKRLPGHARDRQMRGEAALVEALRPLGFEDVAFETLSPLEQIGLMANAEMMISPHGAGFTNMLFANPAARIVEVGTLQTLTYRWGEFWKLANVSGCSYVSFIADHAKEDPTTDPKISVDGIVPVHLSPHGLQQVMDFVTTSLGAIGHYDHRRDLLRIARQMNQVGAYERVLELIAHHPGVEENDAGLFRELAEAHHGLGNGPEELAALEHARDANPPRAFATQQVVWCARRLGDEEALARALAVLQENFPKRYEDMVKGRPWMRRLA